MSEYNKEDIKNLHYNNNNEIQYEYGGQIYHCSMEHLKEVLVTCWNLQQENKKYKELIDKAINNSQYWIDYYTRLNSDERIALRLQENIDILKEVK